MRARVLPLALLITGCSGASEPSASASEASSDDSSATSGNPSDDATDETETSAESEEEDTEETGGLPPVDLGCDAAGPQRCTSCGSPCDIWADDECPEGEKCTAVSCFPGNAAWDANVCRPIHGTGTAGEPCMHLGTGLDGNDDCAEGLMCWDENPDTGLGYCVAFCTGAPISPECDAGSICYQSGLETLPLCLPNCDPLTLDCPNPHDLCVPHPDGDGFFCILDASGDMGPYGAPCSFPNACNQGLVCVPAEGVPSSDCTGADNCCSPVCDLTQPNTCPSAAEGQECVPWFEGPDIPPGYSEVGVCAIPTEP